MNEKFKNIPVEEDTHIILSSPMKWGDLDVVYQIWSGEGIKAESIIFLNDDVKDIDDETLKADVNDSPIVKDKGKLTMSRGEEFTFVNFNFIAS